MTRKDAYDAARVRYHTLGRRLRTDKRESVRKEYDRAKHEYKEAGKALRRERNGD